MLPPPFFSVLWGAKRILETCRQIAGSAGLPTPTALTPHYGKRRRPRPGLQGAIALSCRGRMNRGSGRAPRPHNREAKVRRAHSQRHKQVTAKRSRILALWKCTYRRDLTAIGKRQTTPRETAVTQRHTHSAPKAPLALARWIGFGLTSHLKEYPRVSCGSNPPAFPL